MHTMNQNPKRALSGTSVTSVTDPFPTNVLPPIVRQMVDEVADVAKVPGVLPGCQAIGIISAALGAGLAMPSDRDPRTFANLYLVPAAESGAGKSFTFKKLMAPVYAYQEKLQARSQSLHYDRKAELLRLKGTLKRVAAGKEPTQNDLLPELLRRKDEIEAQSNHRPKVVCEDVTREKLQVLLAQNGERIFSASADARQVVQSVLNGKGDNPYLKAWSGDPVDVDRISRGEVPLKAPRMSILWLPQPDLMMEMFSRRTLIDNGFLPRVLPCIVEYTPMPTGKRTRRVTPPTERNWNDLVGGLFETYHARQGAPFVLRPEPKVQRLLVKYYNSIVERRGSELADVGPFAARWAEQGWRLVIVLHAATYGRDAQNQTVQAQTAENAISLMQFFSGQQLELLQRTRAHNKTEAVQAVFKLLAAKSEINPRDVQRERIAHSASEARALLEQMVLADKLVGRDHTPPGGGHPTRYYRRRDTRDT